MALKGSFQPAGPLEVDEVERFAWCARALPKIPRIRKRMLQNRELVGRVTDVVQQLIDEPGCDPFFSDSDGPDDGTLQLVTSHARDEIEPIVDPFRKVREDGALAQKIRTHRQHHVQRYVRVRARVQE